MLAAVGESTKTDRATGQGSAGEEVSRCKSLERRGADSHYGGAPQGNGVGLALAGDFNVLFILSGARCWRRTSRLGACRLASSPGPLAVGAEPA